MQDNVTRLCASCGRPLIDGGVDWYCGTSGCEEELTLASAVASAHRLASTAQPEVKALVEAVERSAKMIDKAASAAVDQDSPALAEALDNIEFRLHQALAAYHEAQQ